MKKTLLLSLETDSSTAEVMDWIFAFGGQAIRINLEDSFSVNQLTLSSRHPNTVRFTVRGTSYSTDEFASFWYRQGDLAIDRELKYHQELQESRAIEIFEYQQEELLVLKEAIFTILETKHSLSNQANISPNKLQVLMLASSLGLDIPDTFVETEKASIQEKLSNEEKLISKSISEALSLKPSFTENSIETYEVFTEELNSEKLAGRDCLFPSLIQEKLDKAFELRIFYLDGQCFPMAIFSQLDPQTAVDFRKYNTTKPNRTTPFILPDDIALRIKDFMKAMELKTGSIDMVVTKDDRYVFLEVNPVGQFGMTSHPCNFKLEKKIAAYLINKTCEDEK